MRREMVSTVEEQASPEVSRKVCTSKSRNVCSAEWRYVWTWNDGWNWMGTRWRSYKILPALGSRDTRRILIQDLRVWWVQALAIRHNVRHRGQASASHYYRRAIHSCTFFPDNDKVFVVSFYINQWKKVDISFNR